MSDTPFEGGGFIEPVSTDAEQLRRAARTLARLAGGDVESLRTALQALGLMPYRVSGEARDA